ncbi:MAG: hypothetical protein AB1797_03630 [bacterium]
MAVVTLERLRAKLGEEGVDDLLKLIENVVEERGVVRGEFEAISSQVEEVDKRIEGKIESFRGEEREERKDLRVEVKEEIRSLRVEVKEEIRSLQVRIDNLQANLQAQIDNLQDNLQTRIDNLQVVINSQLKWTVGTIALFGTLITVLMSVFKLVGK